MSAPRHLLAIDQGTTSTKAIVVNDLGEVVATSAPERFEIPAIYPQPGHVEFDPDVLWESVRASAHAALRHARLTWHDIRGLGLANQGETVIAFDRVTGRPIHPAISWQDRRGEEIATAWRRAGLEETVVSSTGLRLDPYFSAPKLAWIMKHVPSARELHAAGRLGLGTSDAWLLWQLTGGHHYVTDVATASRTMLLDLKELQWNSGLAEAFGIPVSALPRVVTNAVPVGETALATFGATVAITGLCVDQQAALFGQRAFEEGQAKITYGTGCFLLANTGCDAARRAAGLLTSVGWHVNENTSYVFDGGIYSAGSLVDWLVELGIAPDVAELSLLAGHVDAPATVTLIPAFSGLAAPHWSGSARACWLGMDTSTDRRQLVRSAIDAIAFRVKEIFERMNSSGIQLESIRVDGGLTHCEPLMQLQSDLLRVPIIRDEFSEATALGVAYFAGLGSGIWPTPAEIPSRIVHEQRYEPCPQERDDYAAAYAKWRRHCAAIIEMGDAGCFHNGDGQQAE